VYDVIANENENWTTPCYVSFTEDNWFIGDSAKNQSTLNPDYAILLWNDWFDKSLEFGLCKRIFNIVHSKLFSVMEINQRLKFIELMSKMSFISKRFQLWFCLKWMKQQKLFDREGFWYSCYSSSIFQWWTID
jgi:hypothetical protein